MKLPNGNRVIDLLFLIAVLLIAGPIPGAPAADNQPETRTVWLGSLDLSRMTAGWGAPLADKSIENKPLNVGGQAFEKGVGTHAPSVMYIGLDGNARRFFAQVGVDDETAGKGSVRFKIYGDGRKLFDSGPVKGREPARPVELALAGVRQLVLVAAEAGDGIPYDHADWANAYIEYTGAAPSAQAAPLEEKVIRTPPPGPQPRINAPQVFGTRPGSPFIYRIPATGRRPMTFAAANLPETLALDANTGIIRGHSPRQRGEYAITFQAENGHGNDRKVFRLVVGDTLALTPPMGWNSWYIYYNWVTDQDMRDAADAMIASGMADFGYMYVNIDDCWAKKRGDEPYRDQAGAILTNEKFPDMKGLTDYIHHLGLRAGIYTSPGPWTCAGYVGSYRYEQLDAQQYARWGFDFLKYDWCSYQDCALDRSRYEYVKPYALMGEILKNLDRDMVYNLCQYGMDDVWEWAAGVEGNCWRTTGDLGNLSGFLEVGLSNARHHAFAAPGHWNDPDYILIGRIGSAANQKEGVPTKFTPNQQYQYLSMWSLMAAPLIFSGNMTTLDEFTLNVLCNAEVIEVDQDPLGRQGQIAAQTDETLVMVRQLADGSRAVGLFNIGYVPASIPARWAVLGVEGRQRVRDLWRQKDLGVYEGELSLPVPCHGVEFLRLWPAD
ncbi:MAG: NPCBM/NEW2 domain-containing protein [Sedimentisphaerales bacterium]|nr:NPCBM/NEW2 domain-containing protein [Sedimentisphaerales bacterium]